MATTIDKLKKHNTWQVQDAKSRFSEVVKRAQVGEVQTITKHGKEAVVVLSYDDYLALSSQAQNQGPVLAALDSLLIATAVKYSLTLVTRNTKDFSGLQLKLVNPWD